MPDDQTSAEPVFETAPCSTCAAPIIWTVTTNGKRMPVDAEPVAGGNVRLTERPGLPPMAKVVGNPAGLFGVKRTYVSHFTTCPQAGAHRRRSR